MKTNRILISGFCIIALTTIFSLKTVAQTQLQKNHPTNYFIIVTGGELLEGVISDSHTSFITRTLLPLGLHCVGSIIVDDNRNDIISALKYATNKSKIVIVTGGLGPTANDITRETLSEFTGIPLQENSNLVKQMEQRFNLKREYIRQNLIKQTMIPSKGGYLNNAVGTASGLIFDSDDYEIIALPGPPRELQRMVKYELLPYLEKKYGIRPPYASVTVRFVGIGQSQIDDVLRNKINIDPDIIVGSIFEGSRVDFTFSLHHDPTKDPKILSDLVQKLQQHFKESIYSTNGATLESVVAGRLIKHQITQLVIADACRAYFLNRVLNCDEFRKILHGAYSAADNAGLKRILRIGEPDDKSPAGEASFIANALSENNSNRLAICISEPTGSSADGYSVVIAMKAGDYAEAFNLNIRDLSENSFSYLVTQTLDRLRRHFK